MHSIHTTTFLALLSSLLLSIKALLQTQTTPQSVFNQFTEPPPGDPKDGPTNISYPQGSVINVWFQTDYNKPHLSLFCSYIQNAIENEPLSLATTHYGLKLDYAPQPNCYLHIQNGTDTNSTTAFRTKLFGIVESETGSGNVDEGREDGKEGGKEGGEGGDEGDGESSGDKGKGGDKDACHRGCGNDNPCHLLCEGVGR